MTRTSRLVKEADVMTRIASTRTPAALTAGVVAVLTLTAWIAPTAHAAEFFVNNSSASCSNTGAGTSRLR